MMGDNPVGDRHVAAEQQLWTMRWVETGGRPRRRETAAGQGPPTGPQWTFDDFMTRDTDVAGTKTLADRNAAFAGLVRSGMTLEWFAAAVQV